MPAPLNYSNTVSNAITTATTMSAASTSLQISNGGTLPAVPFTARVGDEILLVNSATGASSTALTVERAFDNTVAVTHSTGLSFTHVVGAGAIPGTLPGWITALGQRLTTPHADDDEFDDESFSGWTQVTPSGSVTLTEAQSVLSGVMVNQTSNDVCAIMKPIASGTTVTIDVAWRGFMDLDNYLMFGPIFSIGTTDTSNCIWQMTYLFNGSVTDIRSGTFTNISTDHSSPGGGLGYYAPYTHFYQRFEYDSTNGFKQYFSPDGITFSSFGGGYVTNPLGGAPTHMGIGFSTWGGSTDKLFSIEYFRVTTT